MKAVVKTRSGPPEVLQLQQVEKPAPGEDEVLIRIAATTVTRGDVILRGLSRLLLLPMRLLGHRDKKIPGHELAGVVEAAGGNVTRFKPGDRVFGTTSGLPTGAYAEYACLPETGRSNVLATLPANASFAEAAALPVGGMTALYILRKADLQPGQKALIYGASGSVGTYAVQLARVLGAAVTGVCSGANVALVQSLGATQVIDYTQEDFTQRGERYDVIFDAVGKLTEAACRGSLAAQGIFLTVQSTTRESAEALTYLKERFEAGELRAVIDRSYPLEQAAAAHRYVETGRKRGNVVIEVEEPAGRKGSETA